MERTLAKVIFLLAFTLVIVLSCSRKEKEIVELHQLLVETVSGTWQGTIPCADCPGIEYELTLKPDKTYREQSVYLEEDVQPFIDAGNWEINKDSVITLGKEGEGMRYFKFTGEALKVLDAQKQPITTGLAEFYILKRRSTNDERK